MRGAFSLPVLHRVGNSTPSCYLSAEVNFVAAHQFLFSIFQQNSWLKSSVLTHTVTEQVERKCNYFYTFHEVETSVKVGQRLVNSWWTGTVCMTDVLWLEENKWIFYICSWSQSSIWSPLETAAHCSSGDLSRSWRREQQCVDRETVRLNDV